MTLSLGPQLSLGSMLEIFRATLCSSDSLLVVIHILTLRLSCFQTRLI